jgi:ATP-binding protein involved in chromosome partitioning
VDWGELDYLIVDLPPGTGDAQLTLCQAAPLAGAIIVTTPQPVALEDVKRGVRMFEKVNVPVLGIVENMALFICPNCGSRHDIFAHGGGAEAAREFEVPFLGEIPIDPAIREGGDRGIPAVVGHPDTEMSAAFRHIASEVARELSILAFPAPLGSQP